MRVFVGGFIGRCLAIAARNCFFKSGAPVDWWMLFKRMVFDKCRVLGGCSMMLFNTFPLLWYV